ncbi:MAG: hypothetical protein DRN17_08075 [Thermoplasmata archaeon]|nr:MAG: hypothetical protein DRN17_08075 [Thermoplasmata archaeon]
MNEERIVILEGKLNVIIDMWTGRQTDVVDGEKIQKFIDNYAVVNTIIENDSITELIHNIVSIGGRFNDVSARIDGLLGAIEVESEKLVSNMGDGASGVALNIADMVMFQTSVSDAYKSMLQHLSDIDITGKINSMESALRESMGLIDSMKTQKAEITILLNRIAENKALIDNMADVNVAQTQLIDNTETMIAEMEKQIENYAFYSEEFDKVYTTAITFVSRFGELVRELERVSARDAKLESLMGAVISLTEHDFTEMESITDKMVMSLDAFAASTAQKLNDMLMFVNEYNAIGTALSAIKGRMIEVTSATGEKITELDAIEFSYTA